MLAGGASASSIPVRTRNTAPQDTLQILKCPPFEATDYRLFSPQTYADAPPMIPAAAKPSNEAEIRQQLETILTRRFADNQSAVDEATAIYTDNQLNDMIADSRLRASLAALKGTPGEAAIDVIKNGTFSAVRFDNLGTGVIAAVKPGSAENQKPELLINKRYENEDFRLLSPSFVHEALHQDNIASGREERISHALDSLIYGKLVQEDPALAQTGTELARRQNTKLMARLNSRDEQGQLRLFTAKSNVYPGGTPLENFGAAFKSTAPDSQYGTVADSSPGNEALKQYLQSMAGTRLEHPDFDAETEQRIDENQTALTPEEVVNAAKALKLNVDCVDHPEPQPPTQTSGAAPNAVMPAPIRMVGKFVKYMLG